MGERRGFIGARRTRSAAGRCLLITLDQKARRQAAVHAQPAVPGCHQNSFTGNVPGTVVMSMLPLSDNLNDVREGLGASTIEPRLRTGGADGMSPARKVPRAHLGNVPVYHVERSYTRLAVAPALTSVSGKFDTTR